MTNQVEMRVGECLDVNFIGISLVRVSTLNRTFFTISRSDSASYPTTFESPEHVLHPVLLETTKNTP
jgi:hypothetical protein